MTEYENDSVGYSIEDGIVTFWGPDSGNIFYRNTITEQPVQTYRDYTKDGESVTIQFVPGSELGYGVLGRSLPEENFAQVDYSLIGEARELVLKHELCHIEYPDWSELRVREATDTLEPSEVLKKSKLK
ncbi:MAG TPA: hypothetical protein VI933_00425 [archaeon]|nr:hypothetical protein [archaeon]